MCFLHLKKESAIVIAHRQMFAAFFGCCAFVQTLSGKHFSRFEKDNVAATCNVVLMVCFGHSRVSSYCSHNTSIDDAKIIVSLLPLKKARSSIGAMHGSGVRRPMVAPLHPPPPVSPVKSQVKMLLCHPVMDVTTH